MEARLPLPKKQMKNYIIKVGNEGLWANKPGLVIKHGPGSPQSNTEKPPEILKVTSLDMDYGKGYRLNLEKI